ncbi:MAG: NUDIX domain-containing protein [Porticoccus sp.]|nr:NUDIX domain-containing protein [Porticoccus sp.]
MTSHAKKYASDDVEIQKREEVYGGFFKMIRFSLRHKLFSGAWSKPFQRELLERGNCVGVLLYDPVHKLVGLVEQFRIGALEQKDGPWLFEVVAGMVDPGESLEVVACREVAEEAGIDNLKLQPICDYWVTPGGSSERMYLYCALTDLTGCGGVFGLDHESEDILLHVLPQTEAFSWLDQGRCNNAATTICLMWLRANCEHLAESAH